MIFFLLGIALGALLVTALMDEKVGRRQLWALISASEWGSRVLATGTREECEAYARTLGPPSLGAALRVERWDDVHAANGDRMCSTEWWDQIDGLHARLARAESAREFLLKPRTGELAFGGIATGPKKSTDTLLDEAEQEMAKVKEQLNRLAPTRPLDEILP